ncbi:hypothetical protein TH53_15105 [Pedobacter lusitanus]|uniref:Uncharacterized protein n=1 Tax=Pedobacter lusitanus TaxID=1503925 RepID=A0A0D0GPI8_9SPHI|nr:hypothetical protein [Pedobacter lusitanus]KIO76396.1 hypothetical protein TH53_15105 [Pedobacter lusitanus]
MTIQSCNSKSNGGKDKAVQVESSAAVSAGFDLADVTFKETIQSVDKSSGVSVSTSPSEEKTLTGYERVESTSPKLLTYNHSDLSGTGNNMTNKVIFHYTEKDSILAMYELRIYNAAPNNGLVKSIEGKAGKPAVDRAVKDSGSGVDFRQCVWVKDNVIYFLLQELDKTGVKTSNLAVFKNDNKDIYKLLGQKGYAISPQSLIEEALAKAGK